MSEPSKAGDGSLERLREEATEDVVKEQVAVSDDAARQIDQTESLETANKEK